MALRVVDRTGGSKWAQAQPAGSKWAQAQPAGGKWAQAQPAGSKWVLAQPAGSKWNRALPGRNRDRHACIFCYCGSSGRWRCAMWAFFLSRAAVGCAAR